MLDEKDLQAIANLMDEKIKASETCMMERINESETRMMERINESETRMMERINESETCMMERISDSESRMTEKISDSESRMMAMMEAYFEPRFQALGDQMQLLQEKMVPAGALEEAEDRIDVLEAVVKQHSREIKKLKMAQ